MSKKSFRAAVIGLAVMAGVIGAGSAATADTRNPAVGMALSRIADGSWTEQDLMIVRSQPTVAAMVPDPSMPAEMEGESRRDSDSSSGRWSVDATYTKMSLLGLPLYRWHHLASYRSNGYRVVEWTNRDDYLTDNWNSISAGSLLRDYRGPLYHSSADSVRERSIQYCVSGYGCYRTSAGSRLTVTADGEYWSSDQVG